MSTPPKLVAVIAVATFTLAGCGTTSDTGSSPTSSGSQSGTSSSSRHNGADVSFATDMVPHHAQAVVMATMALTRAKDPQVKALAADIEAAQGPEIEHMAAWLRTWGDKVPATDSSAGDMSSQDMSGQDMGAMVGDMPGMMSSDQMSRLGKASGATFDRMWLQLMVQHHRGAIEMAETEQRDGRSTDAVALAKRIAAAQSAEISRMREMLGV